MFVLDITRVMSNKGWRVFPLPRIRSMNCRCVQKISALRVRKSPQEENSLQPTNETVSCNENAVLPLLIGLGFIPTTPCEESDNEFE